jgi:hypothetical protein
LSNPAPLITYLRSSAILGRTRFSGPPSWPAAGSSSGRPRYCGRGGVGGSAFTPGGPRPRGASGRGRRADQNRGTVTSTPAGILCGTACSATYVSGTAVTLTATPAIGSTFTRWSGGGCAGTAACTLADNTPGHRDGQLQPRDLRPHRHHLRTWHGHEQSLRNQLRLSLLGGVPQRHSTQAHRKAGQPSCHVRPLERRRLLGIFPDVHDYHWGRDGGLGHVRVRETTDDSSERRHRS